MSRVTYAFPLLLALAAACREQGAVPTAGRPLFAAAAPAACPTPATVTVSDEAGLRAAIAAATPGTVIGIQGMIGLTQDDTVRTAGITITCATPGSGLFAVAGGSATDMLTVDARKVSVDHLVLDASQAIDGPYLSENDGVTAFAVGAVVTDNTFQALGPFTGIQLQTNGAVGEIRIDGVRVERNTLVTTAPSTGGRQGAIRPFDAANAVIADNTAIGPWRAGVSATRLANSRVSGNTIQGARLFGIQTSPQAVLPVLSDVFSNNRVSGAGVAGVFVRLACGNTFVGNNLQGNASNLGLVFDATSGANSYAGDRNLVVDNGAFDCNGDGVNDPNIISGPGMARHGLGMGVSEAAGGAPHTVHGIVVK